jgi:DNA-binding beta-propeller fold protein YncE
VDVAPDGNVYIGAINGVRYYTGGGSFLGSWGSQGTGPGQFDYLEGLAVAPDGTVFTCERVTNNRVQYFTPTGSYLGQWGSYGQGPGEFDWPNDIDVSPTGARVYVLDIDTARVQYFNRNVSNVVPASLGRVKAIFK